MRLIHSALFSAVLFCFIFAAPLVRAEEVLTPEEEEVLDSPTKDYEKYEAVREKYVRKTTVPDWSTSLSFSPRAFKKSDMRVGGALFNQTMPDLYGVFVSGDRIVFKYFGFFSLGLTGGVYGSVPAEQKSFRGLFPMMYAAGPYAHYQLIFFNNQWVVPFGMFQAEEVYYDFSYGTKDIKGFRTLLRADVGGMVYLNFLESTSAANLDGNWGIKRTYLQASFSIAQELGSQDFSLTEQTLRAGFRFEM